MVTLLIKNEKPQKLEENEDVDVEEKRKREIEFQKPQKF